MKRVDVFHRSPRRDQGRRHALGVLAALPFTAPRWALAQGAGAEVVLATPGPGSAVSLIPELAARIGADKAEGFTLRLKFVSGGGVAIREMYNGNAQFGVFGLPAAMRENISGQRLLALAAVEDRTALSLMVRSDLRATVRHVEDLRGRALGIHSNTLATSTTGQQFLNLVLRQSKVEPEAVRFVAAGQTWDSQSNALRSRLVDALVSEEPFGLRLEQAGLAFPLVQIGHPGDPQNLPGMGFLRGTLVAPTNVVSQSPELCGRVVRALVRTLGWLRQRPAAEVVQTLGLAGEEAQGHLALLTRFPSLFSPDGRFSMRQLSETDEFFRESAGRTPEALAYRASTMVEDRWSGRKP